MKKNIKKPAQDLKTWIENEFFHAVPVFIAALDNELNIVYANEAFKSRFGDWEDKKCFDVYKSRDSICEDCTSRFAFSNGKTSVSEQTGYDKNDKLIHYIKYTVPVIGKNNHVNYLVEISTETTRFKEKTAKLQNRLEAAHNYLESLINTSMDGIVGISKRGRVEVFNSAARSLFNIAQGQIVSQEDISTMLPKGFLAQVSEGRGHVYLPEVELKRSNGEKFYGRLIGNKLRDREKAIGMAFSVHDISQVKKLEKEKIEAERMAIVGQTVAGLAHGIKNLINALDGGIYFLKSGIGKGDIKRVHKGIETLTRNIERIRLFSKAFLNYSRFRTLTPALSNPAKIVNEVVESFTAKIQKNSIKIELQVDQQLSPVPLDYEKIHECMTNLVGNAIDACIDVDDNRKKTIWIKIYDEEGSIYIEVKDNGCGIDNDHRQRLFSKFFTTKGLEGTGLGLLMTKKIIQEHGGNISVLSKKGQGSIFRIRLIRGRLPKISS